MDNKELEGMLAAQLARVEGFIDGYKACAKYVLDNFKAKDKDNGIPDNQGNSEVA